MPTWAKKFQKNKLGMTALFVVLFFALLGLYAPFLASSKPFIIYWQGRFYFPFFRYLFFSGFYTKPIDLFYNILMFLLPCALLGTWTLYRLKKILFAKFFLANCVALQLTLFALVCSGIVKDPTSDYYLFQKRQQSLTLRDFKQEDPLTMPLSLPPTWHFELAHMTPYKQLDILIKEQLYEKQHKRIINYIMAYEKNHKVPFPTKWNLARQYDLSQIELLEKELRAKQSDYEEAKRQYSELIPHYQPLSHAFIIAKHALQEGILTSYENFLPPSADLRSVLESARFKINHYLKLQATLHFLTDKQKWLAAQKNEIKFIVSPPLRPFHWEESAAGSALANQYLPWYEVTRSNRKDLTSALLFGIRISFVVGVTAVVVALLIGGILGMLAGYFAGKLDLIICRLIEIWEAMPTFFMLLLIVAITQSKSIFLVVLVLGLFGWTGFARFMRAEVLKQRNASYTMAAKALGLGHMTIMRGEILPNAIAPVLTLLPFSMMAAITSEAALSFLGLGEEGSSSLGVLMDEGRHAFPGESYLLWPAAILLTLLLIAIAIVGDALRDAIDPKS